MRGEKIAVFVFLFATLLALLIGTFNSNNFLLSPEDPIEEYSRLLSIKSDGTVLYKVNTPPYIFNDPKSFQWGPDPLLDLKLDLKYEDNRGKDILLEINSLSVPIDDSLGDPYYIYRFYFVIDGEGNSHFSIGRKPKFTASRSITGSAIQGQDLVFDELPPPCEVEIKIGDIANVDPAPPETPSFFDDWRNNLRPSLFEKPVEPKILILGDLLGDPLEDLLNKVPFLKGLTEMGITEPDAWKIAGKEFMKLLGDEQEKVSDYLGGWDGASSSGADHKIGLYGNENEGGLIYIGYSDNEDGKSVVVGFSCIF